MFLKEEGNMSPFLLKVLAGANVALTIAVMMITAALVHLKHIGAIIDTATIDRALVHGAFACVLFVANLYILINAEKIVDRINRIGQ
jgi:high-affinity nickel permease